MDEHAAGQAARRTEGLAFDTADGPLVAVCGLCGGAGGDSRASLVPPSSASPRYAPRPSGCTTETPAGQPCRRSRARAAWCATALDGQPVAGAWVALTDRGLLAVTDAEGRFRFAPLPEGTYQCVARGAGERWPGPARHPAAGSTWSSASPPRPGARRRDDRAGRPALRDAPKSLVAGRRRVHTRWHMSARAHAQPCVLLGHLEPIISMGMTRMLVEGGIDVVTAEGAPSAIVDHARRLAPDAVVLALADDAQELGEEIRAAAPRPSSSCGPATRARCRSSTAAAPRPRRVYNGARTRFSPSEFPERTRQRRV